MNGADARYKASVKAYESQQKALRDMKSGKNPLSNEQAAKKLLKQTPVNRTELLERPREYAVSFAFPASDDDRPTIAVLDAGYTIPGRTGPMSKTCASRCTPSRESRLSGPTDAANRPCWVSSPEGSNPRAVRCSALAAW